MTRFAAIDIGSNAVRILIVDIIVKDSVVTAKKNTLLRVPVRLGDDAFVDKILSDKKLNDLSDAMIAFSKLIKVFNVSRYMACATSALREISNGPMVVKHVKAVSGIEIQIIGGEQEANIIYSNKVEQSLPANKSYLYIDVGGGSTEVSVFKNKKLIASKSFNLGTIRNLDNQDDPATWRSLQHWVKKNTDGLKNLAAIGTGGNINKLYRMADVKVDTPLSLNSLTGLYNHINSYSLKERISVLGLNEDRADVIIPAAEIFITIMKWANINDIYVPRVGMVDGIINTLIKENLHIIAG